jgi:predicted ATPase
MDNPPTSPANLPTYGTPFIGRDDDAATVAALLCAPATRWLSLVGASGAGKTRLSLHVAETLADRFPDGRYFVSLAPVTDPLLVLPAIMRLLAIREVGDASPLDTLARVLETKAMLLIIDNVEQVKQVGPTLEALLARTTRLKLLLTSQESLGQPMERIHQVPPLAIPPSGAALPIADLLTYPAIALFVDRFLARQPDFVFHETNADDVIEICRQVRGLPLAIELIAACNTALSPRDVLFLLRN